MTWAQRQAAVYPPEEGVKARLLTMPVTPPARPGPPRKRRPVKDCEACEAEPCRRHSYDVLASIGMTPAQPLSPDEYVRDWRAV